MLIGAGLVLAVLVLLASSPLILVVTIVYAVWAAIREKGREIKK